MKIYTQIFDIALQSPKRFWVAPYSDFKIGVKIVKNGTPVENEFVVKQGDTTLTADEDKVDGFTTYTLKSNDTGSVEYKVVVEDVNESFKLTQIVTDSTVFEVGAGGGDVPADVATQSWVESQISGFVTEQDVDTAIGTATTDMATQTWVGGQISALVSGGGYGQAPKLSAMTAVYETDWATLSSTADPNTFYVVLPDPV